MWKCTLFGWKMKERQVRCFCGWHEFLVLGLVDTILSHGGVFFLLFHPFHSTPHVFLFLFFFFILPIFPSSHSSPCPPILSHAHTPYFLIFSPTNPSPTHPHTHAGTNTYTKHSHISTHCILLTQKPLLLTRKQQNKTEQNPAHFLFLCDLLARHASFVSFSSISSAPSPH